MKVRRTTLSLPPLRRLCRAMFVNYLDSERRTTYRHDTNNAQRRIPKECTNNQTREGAMAKWNGWCVRGASLGVTCSSLYAVEGAIRSKYMRWDVCGTQYRIVQIEKLSELMMISIPGTYFRHKLDVQSLMANMFDNKTIPDTFVQPDFDNCSL